MDSAAGKGIINVVGTLRELLPNTKILLLGLLPRTGSNYFDSIVSINGRLRRLHDGQHIFYLDMFTEFRGGEAWGGYFAHQSSFVCPIYLKYFFFSVVPSTLFADGVHLTTEGYELWAEVMNPLLYELLED